MADKTISELTQATSIGVTDLFVLEQNNTAKKLTGQTLINNLLDEIDGHGGITSIQKTGTSGLVDTYRITFADTTTVDFNVTNGAKGDTGDAWYVHIKYSDDEPTQDSDIYDTPDNWMGIYSGIAETAPTTYTSYTWFKIKGNTGATGSAASLVSQSVQYATSTSGTVAPSSGWQSSVPSVSSGQYLWTRTVLTFNTGNPVTAYSVSRYGIDGTGSVSSVDNVSPDANGNVNLGAYKLPQSGIPEADLATEVRTSLGKADKAVSTVANQGLTDEEKSNARDNIGAGTFAIYTATLSTTWSGSSAPYSKAQTISGMIASDNPVVDLVPSSTYSTAQDQVEDWAKIYRIVASANTLTFYATEKPTHSLPIKAICMR